MVMKPDQEITVSADTVVTAVWDDVTEVTINGVSGTFNDKIKLNYFFYFPAQLFNDEDAYVILDNDDNGSDNEKEESDLGKALYLYNQAAVVAFNR